MRAVLTTAAVAIACLAPIGIAACGDDGGGGGDEQEQSAPRETADPLPPLPRGWTSTSNFAGGFALGVPPGWSAKAAGAKTTLKAPGGGVAVSITADRTDEALEAELGEYAARIAEELAQGRTLEPFEKPPVPSAEGYESAAVTVESGEEEGKQGEAAGEQRLEVVVVRRPQLAAYPVLIASLAGVKPAQLDPIVNQLVASLRGRPVTPGPS